MSACYGPPAPARCWPGVARQDPGSGLDVLDAESEGQIGYILETQLANALPGTDVVTLLTQARRGGAGRGEGRARQGQIVVARLL